MEEIFDAGQTDAVERSEPRAISAFEEELLLRAANIECAEQEAREADNDRLYEELALVRSEEENDLPAYHSIYEDAIAQPLPEKTKSPKSLIRRLPGIAKQKTRETVGYLKQSAPTWFTQEKPDPSSNRKRFPISAFAAILTIAVCMMMIVAGSLMLTNAESQVNQLNVDIDRLQGEISDLHSEMESDENLLRVREIAVEEYGMVGEEYLKMDYIGMDREEKIEVFSGDRENHVGLSALLSALGLGK